MAAFNWRAAFIGGRCLLEGGVYWRAAFNQRACVY